MKKYLTIIFLILVFPVCVFAEDLTVAAAANAQFVLEGLKTAFEKDSGITIKTIIGSSGKLITQIKNGAPFDVFLSADMEYPQAIYKEGLAVVEPKTYAYGVLVLWTFKDIDLTKGIGVITESQVKKIAIANPQTAPYGREAVNAIKFYKLYPAVNHKLVYGESISQVNQFVASLAADIGFTAKSIVAAPNMKDKGRWVEIDPKAHHPIAQGVVILKYGQDHHSEAAKKFFDFLFSDTAKEIFKRYGYILP
jgi:molybdate transport system substrate-binding protein